MSLYKGYHYERKALNYLRSHGLRLLSRNFKCRFGEIDLIMQDHDTLVFVEVKYRSHTHYGHPIETVGHRKQQRCRIAAQCYLSARGYSYEPLCRFDIVALGQNTPVEWVPSAF